MAVPRNRLSNSKKNLRRSHHAVRLVNLAVCKDCGAKKGLHAVCLSCGRHRGRQVLDVKTGEE
jgi:large subunit ribosomal protein L32